ncbi:uncharacterized protein LOC135198162 [Macrobrachium nipponense]|uniref:uncharacterized protein LOC135198162 n=1 Tax=Macrobrachium nipponense TaxID=159736 RepID=UPI0030C7CB83
MASFGFDTDRFIIEIQDRPAIWDVRLKEYSNKILKAKAWEELCSIFVPNFNELDCQGKNKATTDLQRKWKSLRDSYRRELTLSKKEKSGSGAGSGRKEYLYFKQLSFLQEICATKPHAAESVEDTTVQGDERENPGEPAPSTSNVKRKKSTVHSDEKIILEALARKATAPHDHDKDFLLGLVPDFKSIPESVKFDAKLEIMNVIKRYKQHPSIMHAQSTVPQSQPVLPCTPSPAQLSETQAVSPWSDDSVMSNF